MKRLWLIAFALLGCVGYSVSIKDVEGIFDIRLVCEDRSNPNCSELNRQARLSIIRTQDSVGAAIGYPEQSLSRYIFVSHDLDLKGDVYSGSPSLKNSPTSAHFSEVQITFSIEDKKVLANGIIRDARFLTDIQFSGEQLLSTHSLAPNEILVDGFESPEKAEGRFLAKGTNRRWLVTVRQALGATGNADYIVEISDQGNVDGSGFASGDRIYLRSIPSSKPGTMELIAPLSQAGGFLKWVLWVSPENLLRATKLQGFFYSSNGVFSRLTFERL
ncbi:MAG: hypothetical protein ACKN9V_04185 [Pseudomonadota bacterium]